MTRAGDATHTAPEASRATAQRRILTVLVLAQLLAGAGLAAGITVGALLAEDLLGGPGLSGLPSALFTGGSALAAIAVGKLSRGTRLGASAEYAGPEKARATPTSTAAPNSAGSVSEWV